MSSVDKFKAFYEKMTFKVEVEGLPAMYIDGNSPGQVKNHLRKLVKQPSLIKSVTRQTKTDVKKVYRDKAQGKEEVVEVNIPAGATTGNTIRYQGFGEEGMAGPRGNLHVKIQVVPHKTFMQDGINLHCKTSTSIFDFIISGHVILDTLDGSTVKVNIPAGTVPGTKFSIQGYGMPDVQSGHRGNLFVTINAKVPKGLSQDEVITLQKLRKRLDKKGVD